MTEQGYKQVVQEDEISIKEIIQNLQRWWKYLLTKWLIVFIAGIVGGLLGFIYAYSKKPIYIAELSFVLEEDKSSGGMAGALGIASQLGFDFGSNGGSAFSEDNLLELMKSRTIVEKTLLTSVQIGDKIQTLVEIYIDFNELRDSWKSKPKIWNIKFSPDSDRSKYSRAQDSLLGIFHNALIKNNLSVDKIDKKSNIIKIRVNTENELFSKCFAEVLAKEVSNFYVDTKTKKSVNNLSILQHQTDSVRRMLNGAITGVASSLDINPNANPAMQILRAPSQRRQVDVQANQAILTELVKNLEMSKLALRRETPLIQIIDAPRLPLTVDRLSKKKGTIIGGIVFGFLSVLYLMTKRLVKLSFQEYERSDF